jgi:hypothetical protein
MLVKPDLKTQVFVLEHAGSVALGVQAVPAFDLWGIIGLILCGGVNIEISEC